MRVYREKDFDDMASRVVDRFLRGETKLADAAVHEAMAGQLNPDQIERLVQAANTMAFLRMMDMQKAQGGDLTQEFDPVDTRAVLQQIIDQMPISGGGGHAAPGLLGGDAGGHPHAEPDGDEGPLPDEMGRHRAPPFVAKGNGDGKDESDKEPPIDDDNDGPFPKGEKQKAKDDANKKEKKQPPAEPKKDEQKEAAIRQRRMRKLAELLDDQYRQAELAFEERFEKLSREFKVAHGAPLFDAFEKDAMALDDVEHGAAVLNLLRAERGLEPVAVDDVRQKHASMADRHVVADYEAIRLFESLVKLASDASRVRRGAEIARSMCG